MAPSAEVWERFRRKQKESNEEKKSAFEEAGPVIQKLMKLLENNLEAPERTKLIGLVFFPESEGEIREQKFSAHPLVFTEGEDLLEEVVRVGDFYILGGKSFRDKKGVGITGGMGSIQRPSELLFHLEESDLFLGTELPFLREGTREIEVKKVNLVKSGLVVFVTRRGRRGKNEFPPIISKEGKERRQFSFILKKNNDMPQTLLECLSGLPEALKIASGVDFS